MVTPAPVARAACIWRAGFDECHGVDICTHWNWANVQTDAETAGVFNALWITVTMLYLLGNLVLIKIKHTAGLSISWKVLFCIQLLAVLLHMILDLPAPAVTVRAQAIRATGNEVGGLPSPILLDTGSLSASYPPRFPRYSFTRWPRKTRFAATTWWR